MNQLKKIWFDTTTTPAHGKYSRKSLMMWMAFLTGIALSFASIWSSIQVDLIVVLLCFGFGITALSVADKYFNKPAKREPETPPLYNYEQNSN